MCSKTDIYNLGYYYNSNNDNDILYILDSGTDNNRSIFMQGFLERFYNIEYDHKSYYLKLQNLDSIKEIQKDIIDFLTIIDISYKHNKEYNYIYFKDIDILDILFYIYNNNKSDHYLYKYYLLLSNHYNLNNTLSDNNHLIFNIPICNFSKVDKNAIIPYKEYGKDAGYTLYICSIYKKVNNNIIIYDTGISVDSVVGYYFEVLPKKNIVYHGYICNNTIIEPNKNILISLIKLDNNIPDLSLPFKCATLVLRKFINYELSEL